MTVIGLPFTSRNSSNLYPAGGLYIASLSAGVVPYVWRIPPNGTSIELYFITTNATVTAVADTNATNTTQVLISGHYFAAN
jgi:hypothetical protein